MPKRIRNRLKFLVERLVLRGAHYRLLVIAALIGLLSVFAGAIVHFLDAGVEGGFGDAVWWAFLRLSDPGYLGDDVGTLQRFVSTLLTVLGYVVFLGALVAIMTQWLHERMRALEAGLTPIAQSDHILIIGWTSRTPTIVRELVMSENRVRHFLRLHGARRLRIAILANEVTSALRVELRDRLGALWNERQVILRTGSPLRLEHLRRVDFINAAAVILPASETHTGGAQHADTRAIKTLLGMTNHPLSRDGAELPLAVAEVFDARKVPVALRAYGGPIEVLASNAIISRLIAQNVRHRGLSHVFGEVLTHGHGNEIYVRDGAVLDGETFGNAVHRFESAVPLGVVRRNETSFEPLLNPPPDLRIDADDRLILLARSFQATDPAASAFAYEMPVEYDAVPRRRRADAQRVLVLGWNHKAPALLNEFDSYDGEQFEIDLVSTLPVPKRKAALARHEFTPHRVKYTLIEDDYTTPSLLRRIDPASYDSIVLLGSDWLDSGEESDARSILGYLLLRDVLPEKGGPGVLIELFDPGNVSLFRRKQGEVIVGPLILSHMLAQVALRRELRSVFDELFGPAGAEIVFRPASEYGLAGAEHTFREIQAVSRAAGDIALGVRSSTSAVERFGGISLNPARERAWLLNEDDDVVVLARER